MKSPLFLKISNYRSLYVKMLLTSTYTFLRSHTCLINMIGVSIQCRLTSMKSNELSTMFSETECATILSKVNNSSVEELQQYPAVTPSIAKALCELRQKEDINSLEKLLNLKGFGPKRLLYLGQNILQNMKRGQKKLLIPWKNIHPSIVGMRRPTSVIGLSLKLPHLYWVHMSGDYNLQDWQVMQVVQEGKFDPVKAQNQLWDIIPSLPKTDVFTIEESQVKHSLLPYILTSIKTEIMLTTLLNCAEVFHQQGNVAENEAEKLDWKLPQKVYRIKSSFLSHFFKLYIGGERMCVEKVVTQLLTSQYDGISVTSDQSARFRFVQLQQIQQEHVGSCLLQTVLFYKVLDEMGETFSGHHSNLLTDTAEVQKD